MAKRYLCPVLATLALCASVACIQDANAIRARVQTRLAVAESTPTLPLPTTTPTATDEPTRWYAVANTGGDGVYIRRTPRMGDRIVAWPDGTRMESLFQEERADGRLWRRVRDPQGNVGWVPAEYLVAVESTASPPTPQPATREAEELYRRVPEAKGAGVRLDLELLIVDFGRTGQVSPRVEAQILDWYLEKVPGRERYELRVRAGARPDGQPIERIWRWEVATRTLRLAETAPPGAPPFACWRWDNITSTAIRQAGSTADGWGAGRSDLAWCGIAPTPTPTPEQPTATPLPQQPTRTGTAGPTNGRATPGPQPTATPRPSPSPAAAPATPTAQAARP